LRHHLRTPDAINASLRDRYVKALSTFKKG
jgi:hypothetical protein